MIRRIGLAVCCLAAALIGTAAGAQTAKPMQIMSINQCTDQLLLALVAPYRIASVSWLSRDPHLSLLAAAAANVGANHGQAEDVVLQKPDLVIADTYASAVTRGMLRKLGYALLEVPPASDLAGVRRAVRMVAEAVGEQGWGEVLLKRMDDQLAALQALPPLPVAVAAWDRDGLSGAKGGIYDAVLAAAGLRDVGHGALAATAVGSGVEGLLAAAPDFLLVDNDYAAPSLRDTLARHPVVRRYWSNRTVALSPSGYLCGTPFVGDIAIALRQRVQAALAIKRAPLPFASKR